MLAVLREPDGRRTALPELVDLPLERGEPLLELLEPAHALLQLVEAVAHRVHRTEDAVGARRVGEPLDRVFAQVGQAAEESVLAMVRTIPARDSLDTWNRP